MGQLGFREVRPGDVEAGTITAEHRTDTAHVSIGGKIHDTCSFPANKSFLFDFLITYNN